MSPISSPFSPETMDLPPACERSPETTCWLHSSAYATGSTKFRRFSSRFPAGSATGRIAEVCRAMVDALPPMRSTTRSALAASGTDTTAVAVSSSPYATKVRCSSTAFPMWKPPSSPTARMNGIATPT